MQKSEPTTKTPLQKTSVDKDTLQKAWKNYTDTLEKKGEKYMASILKMTTPKINENNIEYFVSNEIAMEKAEAEKEKLERYLRNFFNNDTLKILVGIDKNLATSIRNKTAFDEGTLKHFWGNYISALEKKGEKHTATILSMTAPKINEKKIGRFIYIVEYFIRNKEALKDAEKEKESLQQYLREVLKNDGIEIVMGLDETINTEEEPNEQKLLEKLLKENPNFTHITRTFNLYLPSQKKP